MIEAWLAQSLAVGAPRRGCRVGCSRVDMVFARPRNAIDMPSGQAMRLAEVLVAEAVERPRTDVRVATLPPTGRPVASVLGGGEPPSVSVSHADGLLGAAVSRDAFVGLDIVAPETAGRGLDAFLSPDELALLPDDTGLLRALLWAAKEAAFKAARLDVEFRPREVAIRSLSPAGFDWAVATPFADASGAGGFFAVARHVVAVATKASPREAACRPTPVSRLKGAFACS